VLRAFSPFPCARREVLCGTAFSLVFAQYRCPGSHGTILLRLACVLHYSQDTQMHEFGTDYRLLDGSPQ
jgi:hypothetical protein